MKQPLILNDRYELISTLGQGGMACVFKALDTRLQVEKAIKIPNRTCLDNPKIRMRFESEAQVMAKLSHKHIATVHDIVEDVVVSANDDTLPIVYIIMEMLPGGSLQDRIKRHGPLHPQQAITAAIAMTSGLGYAHAHNVVHRDVKLDNILIGSDNTLKLTDFGIAQLEGGSGMTQTGATMGTLAYMAPEQKLSSRKATAHSDLYSVGASLYTMLTNRNPSELYAEDIQETAFEDLPAEVSAFLKKCCHFEPTLRHQSADDLIEELEALRVWFGSMPEDTPPFYIKQDHTTLFQEDVEEQLEHVSMVWTSMLGLETSSYSSVSPPNHTPSTRTLGHYDTALDVLGIDLYSDPDLTNPSEQKTKTLTSTVTPAQEGNTTTNPESASRTVDDSNPASKAKRFVVATILFIIGVGTLLSVLKEDPATTPIPSELETMADEQLPSETTVQPTVKVKAQKPINVVDIEQQERSKDTSKKPTKPQTVSTPSKVKKKVPKSSEPKSRVSQNTTVDTNIEETVAVSPAEKPPQVFGTIIINAVPYSKVYIKGEPATCAERTDNGTKCTLTLPVGGNDIELRNTLHPSKVWRMNIKEGNNGVQCWNFALNSTCPRAE